MQDYYLKKLQWALVSTATYQVSLQWTNQPSISVKEDITIYGCGSSLGLCDQDHSKELMRWLRTHTFIVYKMFS